MAQNLSWFENDYRPINSYYTDTLRNQVTDIIGIGTVILPTRSSPRSLQNGMDRVVRLKNVLHAPKVPYNIIGRPILEDHWVTTYNDGSSPSFIAQRATGKAVAYFKPFSMSVNQFELQITTPSPFIEVPPSRSVVLGASIFQALWSDTEKRKVAALLRRYENRSFSSSRSTMKKHMFPAH